MANVNFFQSRKTWSEIFSQAYCYKVLPLLPHGSVCRRFRCPPPLPFEHPSRPTTCEVSRIRDTATLSREVSFDWSALIGNVRLI